MADTAEPSRLLGELIRLGAVSEVDRARCRVQIDEDLETDWINMPVPRAGKVRVWSPLSVGEQVVVACPEGEIAGAAVIGVLTSDNFPPPATDERFLILFDDGCSVSYDPAAHQLAVALPDGGVFDLVAPGGLNITGPVTIKGNVEIEGAAHLTGDVKAGNVSLLEHKHGQVAFGSAQSGKPV